MEQMLTLDEVARVLRCSKTHVSNLTRGLVKNAPPLPAVRLGRKISVWPTTLEKYLRDQEAARYNLPRQDVDADDAIQTGEKDQ